MATASDQCALPPPNDKPSDHCNDGPHRAVNVRALALFFQRIETQNNGQQRRLSAPAASNNNRKLSSNDRKHERCNDDDDQIDEQSSARNAEKRDARDRNAAPTCSCSNRKKLCYAIVNVNGDNNAVTASSCNEKVTPPTTEQRRSSYSLPYHASNDALLIANGSTAGEAAVKCASDTMSTSNNSHSDHASHTQSKLPVPRPRLSILRKKWYSELNFGKDDDKQSASTIAFRSCETIAECDNHYNSIDGDEPASSSSPVSDDIYSEIDCDDEGIYEELPCSSAHAPHAGYKCGNSANSGELGGKLRSSATTESNKFRSSLSSLLQKSKFFSTDKQIRRTLSAFAKSCDTLLLGDAPSRPQRCAPRPPSIEQLVNRPIHAQSHHQLLASSSQQPCNFPTVRPPTAYADAPIPESDIYASIGGSEGSSDYYQSVADASDSEEIYHDAEDADLYGESEDIYETILNDDGTLRRNQSLPRADDECNVYYNELDSRLGASFEKKLQRQQRALEKRRKSQQQKLKRKYNLNGNEIPVNWGIVKADAPKTRSGDLKVRAGEVVLILRMQYNPPGKTRAASGDLHCSAINVMRD